MEGRGVRWTVVSRYDTCLPHNGIDVRWWHKITLEMNFNTREVGVMTLCSHVLGACFPKSMLTLLLRYLLRVVDSDRAGHLCGSEWPGVAAGVQLGLHLLGDPTGRGLLSCYCRGVLRFALRLGCGWNCAGGEESPSVPNCLGPPLVYCLSQTNTNFPLITRHISTITCVRSLNSLK